MEPFILELNINRVSAQEHHILMITLYKHAIIQSLPAVCNTKMKLAYQIIVLALSMVLFEIDNLAYKDNK